MAGERVTRISSVASDIPKPMINDLEEFKIAIKPLLPTAMIAVWMTYRIRFIPVTWSAETNTYCSHVFSHVAVLLKCATSPW